MLIIVGSYNNLRRRPKKQKRGNQKRNERNAKKVIVIQKLIAVPVAVVLQVLVLTRTPLIKV